MAKIDRFIVEERADDCIYVYTSIYKYLYNIIIFQNTIRREYIIIKNRRCFHSCRCYKGKCPKTRKKNKYIYWHGVEKSNYSTFQYLKWSDDIITWIYWNVYITPRIKLDSNLKSNTIYNVFLVRYCNCSNILVTSPNRRTLTHIYIYIYIYLIIGTRMFQHGFPLFFSFILLHRKIL